MGRKKNSSSFTLHPVKVENLQNLDRNSFIQSNPLIEAVFVQPFKELELKVLCLISKYVNENNFVHLKDTERLIKITISKDDFCGYLNTNLEAFYLQMKGLANDLTKKQIRIETAEENNRKSFETIVLFPRIACKNGSAIFHISPFMQPYLQHLKSNFTRISLDCINKISSSHSIKIYKLLKQYEPIGKRTFQVEELKNILGIGHLYQNNFKDFNKRVLLVAKEHIHNSTDIKISFSKVKAGRKVESLIFTIKTKENQLRQAIKSFKKEMDKLFDQKVSIYADQHNFVKKQWISSKKNVEKNKLLFENWKNARIELYDASSKEPIKILPQKFNPYESNIPNWYIHYLDQLF